MLSVEFMFCIKELISATVLLTKGSNTKGEDKLQLGYNFTYLQLY